MTKSSEYRRAKNLSRQLGIPLRGRWIGSTKVFWIREVMRLRATTRQRQIGPGLGRTVERRQTRQINRLIERGQFQTVMNMVIRQKIKLTERQARTWWNELVASGRFHANIQMDVNAAPDDITLNNTTRDFVLEILKTGAITTINAPNWGSDTIDRIVIDRITRFKINEIQRPARFIRNRDGRFFPHINTTEMDLSRYQVYNQSQAYDLKSREHCLIQALIHCGLPQANISDIKLAFEIGCNIRKSDLSKIAEMIKTNIHLTHYDGKKVRRKLYKFKQPVIGSIQVKTYEIALFENHYFINEKTIYSKYSIQNYEDVKDIQNFHDIERKHQKIYRANPDGAKLDSLNLLRILLKKKLFLKLDLSRFEEASSHIQLRDTHVYLDNIADEQREVRIYESNLPTYSKVKDLPSREEIDAEHKAFREEMGSDFDSPSLQGDYWTSPNFGEIVDNIIDDCHKKTVKWYEYRIRVQQGDERNEKPKSSPEIYFADCESFTTGRHHELMMVGVCDGKSDHVNIVNNTYDFMNIITNNGRQEALCYFHNLKYDYHLLEKELLITKKCQKDGQLYSVSCLFKNKKVEFRDSYKLIPFALANFQKEFNLPKEFGKKDAIAYEYYTKKNQNDRVNVDTYAAHLSIDEQKIFKTYLKDEPSYYPEDNTFNPMDYYKEYLRLDCLVLKKGLLKFDKLIKEITSKSIFDSLTISSLTDRYMKKEGAYRGVYEVKGNLREYINKAVYGGRVCVNEKYKKQIIEEKISDYDGVSLYPSAIARLCRRSLVTENYNHGGLPTGKAKRLTDFANWENQIYCIMTIKIKKVKKNQQMPFIAVKNKMSIDYVNEIDPNHELIVDKITLQDYIHFHDIEYEIIDGIYWDESVNNRMGQIINTLFKLRLRCKREGNKTLSNVIKLMLNSSYGKTIMKKTKQEKIIFKGTIDKFQAHLYNNFNTIKSFRKMSTFGDTSLYEIDRLKADASYNRGHIGCFILSMSKRIMNEVFNVANDINCPIYYTDTDSLHCKFDDVIKIENEYREMYGKELNGKNLEQFHTDFDLHGACSEIYATKSIFLGKKSYLDCLVSTDANGKKITGYHTRLKGITSEGMEHAAKDYSDGYFGLYKDLAEGKKKKIILNPYNVETNHKKTLFVFKDGKVATQDIFIREVKF